MTLRLSHNRYGEAGVRLLRLIHRGDRHEIRDLAVDVALEGDFRATHLTGDNRDIVQAQSMKNAVYALAGRHAGGELEEFALALTHHFMLEHEQVAEATVTVKEHRWGRIAIGGRPRDQAFSRTGEEKRVARVRRTRDAAAVEAGIEDLPVMNTRQTEFEGHRPDPYADPEPPDRLLAAVLNARWRYGWGEVPFGLHWQQVRQVILDTFAEHDGRSMQHTLYAMAQAALEQCPPITEIRFRLPHRRHLLADLTPFGLRNENEVFVVTEEPYGVVEATVRREDV